MKVGYAAIIGAMMMAAMPANATDIALNFGALENRVLPGGGHFGSYGYFGISTPIETDFAVLIPGISLEGSEELGSWGLVGTLVTSFGLGENSAVDVIVTLIHDQPGFDGSKAVFLGGIGAGVSLFFGNWTISPSLNVFQGLTISDQLFTPLINFSYLVGGGDSAE